MKLKLLSALVLAATWSVSACRTTGNGSTVRDQGGAANANADSVECPYGMGINASTGGYMSCQCPDDYPLFRPETNRCHREGAPTQPVAPAAMISCNNAATAQPNSIRTLDLDWPAAGLANATVNGKGTTKLRDANQFPAFNFSGRVRSVTTSTSQDGQEFFHLTLDQGALAYTTGNTRIAISRVTISPELSVVSLVPADRSRNMTVNNCATSDQARAVLAAAAAPAPTGAVREVDCPYGVGINASTGGYMSCQCPADYPVWNAATQKCRSR